jgi:branched-subunit amino acid transport protein
VNAYVVVIAVGLLSYAFRVSMLVLAARRGLPPVFERAARFAVPTAFAGLVAGSLVTSASAGRAVAPVLAVAAAAFAVRRTGSPHMALLAGMPVLWAVTAVVAH